MGPEAKEWVYKPSSVHASCDALCGHSSGAPVTRRLGAAYPGMITRRTTSLPLFGLAPDEVFPATCVTAGAVSSYLTISPLPDETGRYIFCGTVCGVTPPGRYPASRPAELGLSSPPTRRSASAPTRPTPLVGLLVPSHNGTAAFAVEHAALTAADLHANLSRHLVEAAAAGALAHGGDAHAAAALLTLVGR